VAGAWLCARGRWLVIHHSPRSCMRYDGNCLPPPTVCSIAQFDFILIQRIPPLSPFDYHLLSDCSPKSFASFALFYIRRDAVDSVVSVGYLSVEWRVCVVLCCRLDFFLRGVYSVCVCVCIAVVLCATSERAWRFRDRPQRCSPSHRLYSIN